MTDNTRREAVEKYLPTLWQWCDQNKPDQMRLVAGMLYDAGAASEREAMRVLRNDKAAVEAVLAEVWGWLKSMEAVGAITDTDAFELRDCLAKLDDRA